MERIQKTLIYKRTHIGDPDKAGRFGIHDCMGKVRSRNFNAVIGIGGIGNEARSAGIDGKVTWIGIGSRKEPLIEGRGPLVKFDHFVLFDKNGPNFETLAPILAEHIYSKNVRVLSTFTKVEQTEISSLLRLAKNAAPSTGVSFRKITHYCPKCC
jgi:hypothetical protein